MQMLVFREFAVQDDQRVYRPGPGLLATVTEQMSMRTLHTRAQPTLELLAQLVGESVNLQVRVGTSVRVLSTVDAETTVVRVGDRRGVVLDAAAASGGVALLSLLDADELTRLYRSPMASALGVQMKEAEFASFQEALRHVRITGWAVNRERTEDGVVAIGAPVRGPTGQGVAAVSISVPATRAAVVDAKHVRAALLQACAEIERGLMDEDHE